MKTLIEHLENLISKENVITSGEVFEEFATSTMKETTNPSAILFPRNELEVTQIIELFNKKNADTPDEKAVLYPLSSGKNWGYTSSEAGMDKAFILSLKNLNQISEYKKDTGSVRIQAGVTQKQLYSFLQRHGAKHWMDATGSSEACSVLANSLERGFGHTPAGNHFEFISEFDIVLGSGERISTGFRQFSKPGQTFYSESIYKWGLGPYIDGLFSQSSMGIVLSATLKLMRAPECYLPFFISSKEPESLGELVESLRGLREKSIVKSCVHIANFDKSIQAALDETDWPLSTTLMTDKTKERHRKKYLLNEWTASGALYGTKEEIAVWKRIIKRSLINGKFKVRFISEKKLAMLRYIAPVASKIFDLKIDKTLEKLDDLIKLKRGQPTNAFLKSVHFKTTRLPNDNNFTLLERNFVGLIWLAPTAPATGEHAKQLSTIVTRCLKQYNIEAAISMTMLTDQALECVISLIYDRRIDGSDLTAEACHLNLHTELLNSGYLTYRMNSLQQRDFDLFYTSSLTPTLTKVKASLDPNGVLAIGKYGIH